MNVHGSPRRGGGVPRDKYTNLPDRPHHHLHHHPNNHHHHRHHYYCLLNGRVSPLNDGFSSINTRGEAIVDYMMTPYHNLKQIKSFAVVNVNELVEKLGIQDNRCEQTIIVSGCESGCKALDPGRLSA